MIHALLTVCLFASALAMDPNVTCPVITPVENFNMTKFMGKWHRVLSTDKFGAECYSRTFRYGKPGEIELAVYAIAISQRNHSDCTSTDDEIHIDKDEAWRVYRGVPERVVVTNFRTLFPESHQQELARRIVATDYDSFAIEMSCADSKWTLDVWTRLGFYDTEAMEEPRAIINKMDIDYDFDRHTYAFENRDCQLIDLNEEQREKFRRFQFCPKIQNNGPSQE